MFGKSGDIQIAARMAQVRHHLGYSQGVMAAKLGLSDSAYKNYEKAKRDMPVSVVQGLCDKFSLDATWLIQGKGDFTEPKDKLAELRVAPTGLGKGLPEGSLPLPGTNSKTDP